MRLDPRSEWTAAEVWSLTVVGIARELVRARHAGDHAGQKDSLTCLEKAVRALDAAEQAERPRIRIAV